LSSCPPQPLWLELLGIRLDSKKVGGKQFKISLVTPDNDEKFVVQLSNGTLTNIKGFQTKDAALTITINRADLEKTMMGAVSFDDQIKSGNAKLEGDRQVYEQLKNLLVQFGLGFEILPGTGAKNLTPKQEPFQQEQPPDTSGG
jgi:linear primary-alkylsulfatase